jgi:hypothetical protein
MRCVSFKTAIETSQIIEFSFRSETVCLIHDFKTKISAVFRNTIQSSPSRGMTTAINLCTKWEGYREYSGKTMIKEYYEMSKQMQWLTN